MQQKIYNMHNFNIAIFELLLELRDNSISNVSIVHGEHIQFPVSIGGLMYNSQESTTNDIVFDVILQYPGV